MAEIYSIPEGNSGNMGGIPFSIPIGGNGSGLFGNGGNTIGELIGLAIVASIFGWNNGGFGFGGNNMGGAGFLSNQLNNDSGRELVMNAINSNGEASRAAIQNLATISGYAKYGDPEIGQGSVIYTGLDTGRYATPRTFQFGVNVTF